jgi:hypothetical protein
MLDKFLLSLFVVSWIVGFINLQSIKAKSPYPYKDLVYQKSIEMVGQLIMQLLLGYLIIEKIIKIF